MQRVNLDRYFQAQLFICDMRSLIARHQSYLLMRHPLHLPVAEPPARQHQIHFIPRLQQFPPRVSTPSAALARLQHHLLDLPRQFLEPAAQA